MKNKLVSILNNELVNLEITITEEEVSKLVDFVLFLDKWNKTYNLTSIKDPKDMLYKHIIDSLVISKHLEGTLFYDVGTGPGIPGIPLAIVNKEKTFHLNDSITKRINFIKSFKRDYKIENIIPILGRCEDIKNDELVDGILSRAFASLSDMLTLCEGLASTNTCFYALKGNIEQREIIDIPHNFEIIDIIPLKVPSLLGNRHLIKIKKRG